MTAQEEDAFLHSWQVALHQLGVRDEYIPATWAAVHAQSAQVLTPILGPTPEEVLLGLRRDYASRMVIKVGWPSYVAAREGLIPFIPTRFHLFDQLLKGVAMAFLNRGGSTRTTPITVPDGNRPGV